MNILFYTGNEDEESCKFKREIEKFLSPKEFIVCHDPKEFSKTLQFLNFHIIILFALNKNDLEFFVSLKSWFWDKDILLILSNQENDTISKAHKLQPRFIGYTEDDVTETIAVLYKMFRKTQGIQV